MPATELPTSDPRYSLWIADRLVNVRRGWNKTIVDQAFQAEYPDRVLKSGTDIYAEVVPQFYVGQLGDTVLILIGCCDNIVMATRLLAGYELGLTAIFGGENNLAREAAEWIVDWMRRNHFATSSRYLVSGHSYGGMVAQSIAAALVRADAQNVVKLVTFGSPREANRENCSVFDNRRAVRWMNDEDPVPMIPPHLSEGPGWAALLAWPVAASWSRYVHIAGGMNLMPDGTHTPAIVPQHGTLVVTAALNAFLVSQATEAVTPHSMSVYRDRLQAYVTANPDPNDTVGGSWEPIDDGTSRGDWGQAERATTQAIIRQGERQNEVPVHIPESQQCHVRKVNRRVYSVYWGDVFIATGPTKKKAFGLKNTFNNFLRRMQRQAVTEPDAMVEQFKRYFDLATEEGNGFQPVMQDEFPEA